MTVYFPNMFNEHHCYGLFTLICVFAQIMSSKHERILIKADFLAAVCRATFPLLQLFFHVTFSMNFPDCLVIFIFNMYSSMSKKFQSVVVALPLHSDLSLTPTHTH